MKVKIEFVPNTISKIESIEQVKNISKDLMETCARCGVVDLTYNHDYFKIHIEQPETIIHIEQPETIIQQDIAPFFQCKDKGE